MTWLWFKRWLEYKRRRSLRRYKKIQLVSSESKEEREITIDKSYDQQPTVYIKDCGNVPLFLVNAAYVIERNVRTKDIFQTKGDQSKAVTSLLAASRKSKLKSVNVHDVVEAMKTFLISLPDPILPDYVIDALINASGEDFTSQYVFVMREYRFWSNNNFAILSFMMRLLKKVSENSLYNCMDARRLATIFVLDIINPLKQKDPGDISSVSGIQEHCITESMQRLPFVITVVENLIQNVSVFQMVDSLNMISSLSKGHPSSSSGAKTSSALSPRSSGSNITEFEHDKTQAELCNKFSGIRIQDPASDFVDVGSRSLTKKRGCKRRIQTERTSSNNMEVKFGVKAGSSKSGSIELSPHKENNVKLNEVLEYGMEMPSSTMFSTDVHVETSTQSRKKLLSHKKAKDSLRRKKSVRVDKAKSSPDRKPTKYVRIKDPACTKKRKNLKPRRDVKKLNSEQEDGRYATYSRSADSISLVVQEDFVPLSNASSNTDVITVTTTTAEVPRLLFLERIPPSMLEDSENQARHDIIQNSQMGPWLSTTERHEDRAIFNSDISGAATTENALPSHSMRIVLNTLGETSEMPEISVKLSSAETTSANKRNATDIIVKSSTGVNTSPGLHISLTSNENIQLVSEKDNETSTVVKFSTSKDIQNGKVPGSGSGQMKNINAFSEPNVTGGNKNEKDSAQPSISGCNNDVRNLTRPTVLECDRIVQDSTIPTVLKCDRIVQDSTQPFVSECDNKIRYSAETSAFSERAGGYNTSTQKELPDRTSEVSETILSRSNHQVKPSRDIHHMIVVTVRNELPKSRFRCCQHHQHRRMPYSLTAPQRCPETISNGALSQALSYRECAVDVFIICTIMVCMCLLLHNLQYAKHDDDDWNE